MSTLVESELSKLVSAPRVDRTTHDGLLDQVDDDSSSSLSEPDDRTGNEDGDDAQCAEEDISDEFDTEAETERLEKTPRKQRDVLLTPSNTAFPEGEDLVVRVEQREASPIEDQDTSDSTLGETGDEDAAPQNSSPLRKRKRAEYEHASKESGYVERRATHVASKTSATPSADESFRSPTPRGEDQNQLSETTAKHSTLQQSPRKGKRKAEKSREAGAPSGGTSGPRPGSTERAPDHGEVASSVGDDVEMEDSNEREGGDVDGTAKSEEDRKLAQDKTSQIWDGATDALLEAKKRSAMESLSAIENCFATLRDKLFDERLTQCNDELALLEQPTFIHPELLLMKEVIDRRRDQKVRYERTLLKYKLETLRTESIANKAQMHSQYMQTVGELRDTYLSQVNAEIYQTQRERRNCEADMPDYLYTFTTKRSKQITDQTAYNEEVSLLSGVAKYVGFPAAPIISMARSDDWEADERLYKHNLALEDEANNARRASQPRPSLVRASLSAASTFGRPPPAAEVQFLQRNAWANPQHPIHQMDSQASSLTQAAIATATPAPQKRRNEPHGSASTIPEHPSAPTSSVPPTPATEEVRRDFSNRSNAPASHHVKDATPSRLHAVLPDELDPLGEQPADISAADDLNGAETHPSAIAPLVTGQESNKSSTLPRPLPFTQGGGISLAPSLAPSLAQNLGIKAETSGRLYRSTPPSHHFQGTPPAVTASTAQMTRFSP